MAGRYFPCLSVSALYPASLCPVPSSNGRTPQAPIHPILPAHRATHHAHRTKLIATMDCFAHHTEPCNRQQKVSILCDNNQRANGMLGQCSAVRIVRQARKAPTPSHTFNCYYERAPTVSTKNNTSKLDDLFIACWDPNSILRRDDLTNILAKCILLTDSWRVHLIDNSVVLCSATRYTLLTNHISATNRCS